MLTSIFWSLLKCFSDLWKRDDARRLNLGSFDRWYKAFIHGPVNNEILKTVASLDLLHKPWTVSKTRRRISQEGRLRTVFILSVLLNRTPEIKIQKHGAGGRVMAVKRKRDQVDGVGGKKKKMKGKRAAAGSAAAGVDFLEEKNPEFERMARQKKVGYIGKGHWRKKYIRDINLNMLGTLSSQYNCVNSRQNKMKLTQDETKFP